MQLTLAAAGLSLLAAADAHLWNKPAVKLVKAQQDVAMNYTWTVTNWNAGCVRSGCYSDFNVSAPAWKNTIPAFKAYCNIGPEGAAYEQCEILDSGNVTHVVSARLQTANTTGTGAHLAVSYEFVDPIAKGTYWNYTAHAVASYNQFVAGPEQFTLSPDEVWGAA